MKHAVTSFAALSFPERRGTRLCFILNKAVEHGFQISECAEKSTRLLSCLLYSVHSCVTWAFKNIEFKVVVLCIAAFSLLFILLLLHGMDITNTRVCVSLVRTLFGVILLFFCSVVIHWVLCSFKKMAFFGIWDSKDLVNWKICSCILYSVYDSTAKLYQHLDIWGLPISSEGTEEEPKLSWLVDRQH